jgi:hypothetical protein
VSVPDAQVWLFWDVDPNAIDLRRDTRYVLGRVLERGRLRDVRWVVSVYGLDAVRDFFRAGDHPEVSGRTRAFWRTFFNESAQEWPDRPDFRKSSSVPWID